MQLMKSSITKYIIGGAVVAVVAGYAIFNANSGANAGSPGLPSSLPPETPTGGSASSTGGTGTATAAAGTSAGQYKNGRYTGPVVDAFYGKVQVAVAIKNGAIANVAFPVYPNNPGHTIQESMTALPALAKEAIAAQSANVNIVSGATQTSQAFQQSLAAALTQAQ